MFWKNISKEHTGKNKEKKYYLETLEQFCIRHCSMAFILHIIHSWLSLTQGVVARSDCVLS